MDESRNLQNDFFNQLRKDKAVVTVFLGNGKKLVGRIKSFDKFTLLLDGHQGEQMIFKHAISTVSSGERGGGTQASYGGRREPMHASPRSSGSDSG